MRIAIGCHRPPTILHHNAPVLHLMPTSGNPRPTSTKPIATYSSNKNHAVRSSHTRYLITSTADVPLAELLVSNHARQLPEADTGGPPLARLAKHMDGGGAGARAAHVPGRPGRRPPACRPHASVTPSAAAACRGGSGAAALLRAAAGAVVLTGLKTIARQRPGVRAVADANELENTCTIRLS